LIHTHLYYTSEPRKLVRSSCTENRTQHAALKKQVRGNRWQNKLLSDQYLQVICSQPGWATAQVVSRRLPTAEARDRAHVRLCGGQSVAGAGFLRVLRSPLPILIPPTVPHLIIYHSELVQ
jgi:hypothetical protein